MKLRIKGDSLRMRLTQSEVQRLASGADVEDAIGFGSEPNESLAYCVRSSEVSSSLSAKFANTKLTISVPSSLAKEWAESERVALEAHNDIGNGRFLHLLIEKDFTCLTPRLGDDDKDTFPHPSAGLSC